MEFLNIGSLSSETIPRVDEIARTKPGLRQEQVSTATAKLCAEILCKIRISDLELEKFHYSYSVQFLSYNIGSLILENTFDISQRRNY